MKHPTHTFDALGVCPCGAGMGWPIGALPCPLAPRATTPIYRHHWTLLRTNEFLCQNCGEVVATLANPGALPPCTGPAVTAPVVVVAPTYGGVAPRQGAFGGIWPAMTSEPVTPALPPEPSTPGKPTCLSCEVELSTTLDACYDRDAWLANFCIRCRDARRRG